MTGRRAPRWMFIAFVATAPALATLALIHWQLQASIADFVPSFWNDQTGYWHYIASFREVGFHSGYYTSHERPAAIDAVHYDVHGPAFQMFYGTIARLVGWSLSASIWFNLVLIALATVVFCVLAQLDRRQTIVLGAVILTSWPVLLFVPTSSQESLHQAAAIGLAGLFSILIVRGVDVGRRAKGAALAFVLAISVVRFGWALLLVPFLILLIRQLSWRTVLVALGVAGAAIVAVTALVSAASAPGGNVIFDRVGDLGEAPLSAARELAASTWHNTRDMLSLGPRIPGGVGGSAGLIQTLQFLGLVAVSAVLAIRAQRGNGSEEEAGEARREWAFHLFNLFSILVFCLVLYLPDGYYRILGAHLLLSASLLVRFRRMALAGALVATNLLALPGFLDHYERWQPNFELDLRNLAAQRAEVHRLIPYDDDAPSPWCNTLLLDADVYDHRVTLVPPGVGVSYVFGHALPGAIKSQYVLLDDEAPRVSTELGPDDFELLGAVDLGRIYRNPSSACRSR